MARRTRLAPLALLALIGTAISAAIAPALDAQGTIRGIINDSLFSRGPLAGATVILQGAPNTATTDRQGRFVMREVPAGTHTIGFFHPILDSLEITAPVQRVTVEHDKTVVVTLAMPTANSLSRLLCERDLEPASSVVFGIVRDAERGEPLPGAVVRAHWFQWNLIGGVGGETQRFESDTAAADGRYVLCSVPNDISLTLSATQEERMTGNLTLALDHLDIGRRDLMVSRSDTAARVPPPLSSADTMPWLRPAGVARLRVTVRGSGGRPVRGATVGIRGTSVNGRTGDDGTVLLVGIPAGSQPLLVRRPGSEPIERIVALSVEGVNETTLDLGRDIVMLPTVAVTGQRIQVLDRELGARVTAFNGRLFDEKQIAELTRGGMGGWMRVPGLRVISDGFDALPLMLDSRMQPCQPNLFVNGARLFGWSAWELRMMLIGAKRMEVYPRPAMQPPNYINQTDCGTIAIWT